METWQLPKRTEADFRHAQLGLMPRGFAWFLGIAGNWWKLFTSFAAGFAAVYDMFCSLVREMSPYTTTSLTDWERELGLPKKGLRSMVMRCVRVKLFVSPARWVAAARITSSPLLNCSALTSMSWNIGKKMNGTLLTGLTLVARTRTFCNRAI